ncbi:MerC domain-containing protein [Sphingopyxis alaskensis]
MCLPSPRARTADLAGIALSSACLVHCLALPLALLVAPALGSWLHLPDGVHAAILMIALPTAAIAINGGRQRHGHNAPPSSRSSASAFLRLASPRTKAGWRCPTRKPPTDC